MSRFWISGWGEKQPFLFDVEPEYGLDGYTGILESELAALNELIKRRGMDAGRGQPAPSALPTVIADLGEPSLAACRPDWKRRALLPTETSGPAVKRAGNRLSALRQGSTPKTTAVPPIQADEKAELEKVLGRVPHWAYFSKWRTDPLPIVLQRCFPDARWERIGMAPLPPDDITDSVRVRLARPQFTHLDGWARFLTHSLPSGSILAIQAGDLPTFFGAVTGLLPPNQRILVIGQPKASHCVGWESCRPLAPGLCLLEGVPTSIRRSAPAPSAERLPRISVVTISYNQAPFLEATLRSVLDQGYPNLEYIVIDGDSTDGSIDILERYRPRLDKLVIEPDNGQSDALCKGFDLATGDILTWLCSDDLLDHGALFRVAEAFATHDVDLVAGGCRLINAQGQQVGIHHNGLPVGTPVDLSFGDLAGFCGLWQKSFYFYQPEVFFTRKIWNLSGGYVDKNIYWAMDYEMFLRFSLARAKIVHIPYFLAKSRIHESQKTRHDSMAYLPTVRGIMLKYYSLIQTVSLLGNHEGCHGKTLPREQAQKGAMTQRDEYNAC